MCDTLCSAQHLKRMRLVFEKISEYRLGWNERRLTEQDFHRICKRFNVKAVEMPLRTNGFYYRVMGRDFIAIDSRLSGVMKLFVQFHELAHFLLHTPESGATANFHGVGRQTRCEREADAVALCALIPQKLLNDRMASEIAEIDGLPPDLVAERLQIFARYGF